ncbi:MAG: nucleotidyltransferase family protein [Deltaproteobacteria bacterium]|nr:nucleotidyltransferase family protein [Deltaproteobacteria bacterium]
MAPAPPPHALEQLRACLRAFPDRPTTEIDLELPGFWELARNNGVGVLVASQLGVLPSVRDLHRAQAAQGIRVLSALKVVLKTLEAAGVAALPLKGPVLAARLYGDFTLRPTSDVDVLVHESDLQRAMAALEAAGAELSPEYAENRGFFERYHHHLGLHFRGLLVELHQRPSSRVATRFPSEALFMRARVQELLELRVRVADPIDELIFLALHAAGHNLERELWLLDLKMLARLAPLDWDALEFRTRAIRARRAVGAALLAAEERVGFPAQDMPAAWRRSASRDTRILPRSWAVEVPQTALESVLNLASDAVWSDSRARGAAYFAVRVMSASWRSALRRVKR